MVKVEDADAGALGAPIVSAELAHERARVDALETELAQTTDALAEKTRECEALQLQLAAQPRRRLTEEAGDRPRTRPRLGELKPPLVGRFKFTSRKAKAISFALEDNPTPRAHFDSVFTNQKNKKSSSTTRTWRVHLSMPHWRQVSDRKATKFYHISVESNDGKALLEQFVALILVVSKRFSAQGYDVHDGEVYAELCRLAVAPHGPRVQRK